MDPAYVAALTVTVVARDQGFKYANLSTGIKSLIDIRGFFFDLHLRPQYEQLNFDLYLATRASSARSAWASSTVSRA